MKILITTFFLDDRAGVELFTRDMVLGLSARNHEVMVYAPRGGALAAEMVADGVEVVRDLRNLSAAPDIIHAQHQPTLIDALRGFPRTPALFTVHATSPLHVPFVAPRVRRYVAVDRRCLDFMTGAADIPAGESRIVLNFVDVDRFKPRPTLPSRPKRALLLSNFAKGAGEIATLRAACEEAGLSFDVMGKAAGEFVMAPEGLLGEYDIVFGKARIAIEAMAVGCAVVICDGTALGEMVTAARFDHLRLWNFGRSVMPREISLAAVSDALARYDASDAAAVSRRIRGEASLDAAIDAWLALYEEILVEPLEKDSGAERVRLAGAALRWRLGGLIDGVRRRAQPLVRAGTPAGQLYRLIRSLWRRLGSPGALFE